MPIYDWFIEKHTKTKFYYTDPCIGPNTFFKAMTDDFSDCHLKGIEIDINLITEDINKFYKSPNRSLIKGSFFDLPVSEKFDLVVQNPPYVRQELLQTAHPKESIRCQYIFFIINYSCTPNLYIYFLLKSILHLKEGGVMVAVIYDSWLYSSFGKFLKESFLKLGRLESIYHFKKVPLIM